MEKIIILLNKSSEIVYITDYIDKTINYLEENYFWGKCWNISGVWVSDGIVMISFGNNWI